MRYLFCFIAVFVFVVFESSIKAQWLSINPISTTSIHQSKTFPIVSKRNATPIFYDSSDASVVKIAVTLLCGDIEQVTGIHPKIDSNKTTARQCIIIGTIGKNNYIDRLIALQKIDIRSMRSEWETYMMVVVDHPFAGIQQALVIIGSDPRGTAFGVFELSKCIGVDPFYWWADVKPKHQNELFVSGKGFHAAPPSVKYRGIFINDEDWGLQPWAAKTMESETNDIGPKTYARVFELLLRLKANMIWPAMHPSTKAFFHYPGNIAMAASYGIMVGSSHAEPMLRNNVDEWNEKTMGPFNYLSNKKEVQQYWEDRVKQSSVLHGMYSMGMRGVHDSKMEGVKSDKEAAQLLESIFEDQRSMLRKYINDDVTKVPQVFTAYKEVLEIYDAGLKVPDDITLVWPDDNYGYIQRLNNASEQQRTGGSGVYYHASYWGRPHDYLWLNTLHPALMQEEMMKAYHSGAKQLWVVNVGDIKPQEYAIRLLLDMAYDAKPFAVPDFYKTHLTQTLGSMFGTSSAPSLSGLMQQFYHLAWERKPEYMGWSQTEPTTQVKHTDYNHFFYGDEAQRRLDAYKDLELSMRRLKKQIPADRLDAYFQLIEYPILGASWMNQKYLYRDKAVYYAKQNRISALDYKTNAQRAHDSIFAITQWYNKGMSKGKWNHIMSMQPRDLPVFNAPSFPVLHIDSTTHWGIAPEGWVWDDSSLIGKQGGHALPKFTARIGHQYFVDLFLRRNEPMQWKAIVSKPWVHLSTMQGALSPKQGENQIRLWVRIDRTYFKSNQSDSATIRFQGAGQEFLVTVYCKAAELSAKMVLSPGNGLSLAANAFTQKVQRSHIEWRVLEGLGYRGAVMQAYPFQTYAGADTSQSFMKQSSSRITYDFNSENIQDAIIKIYTVPTHPLNTNYRMRYGVQVDDGLIQVVDFKTVGRSEEWKINVLRNRAERVVKIPHLVKGNHRLTIYAIDPYVLLDEIKIDPVGMPRSYSMSQLF